MSWKILAAKATGASHKKLGLGCQDFYRYEQINQKYFIAALADGAGSATEGELGANKAVNHTIENIKSSILQGNSDLLEITKTAITKAREEIIKTAKKQSTPLKDYATTLLAVLIDDNYGVAAQIGDGVIVVKDDENSWSWVFWPQHGEYVNNTHFLTDEDALNLIQIDKFDRTNEIAMITDGLERLALNMSNKRAHNPFFEGFTMPLKKPHEAGEINKLNNQLQRYLDSEIIQNKTDDDVSIVLAIRDQVSQNSANI